MKTVSGPSRTGLLQYSVVIFSVFLSVLQWKNGVRFVRAIARFAFYQGILPPNEITIVHPPAGDPKTDPNEYWPLQKTLYGLRCSPRHWYGDKINRIL
jgi:hypothetical protein